MPITPKRGPYSTPIHIAKGEIALGLGVEQRVKQACGQMVADGGVIGMPFRHSLRATPSSGTRAHELARQACLPASCLTATATG